MPFGIHDTFHLLYLYLKYVEFRKFIAAGLPQLHNITLQSVVRKTFYPLNKILKDYKEFGFSSVPLSDFPEVSLGLPILITYTLFFFLVYSKF